jgi:2'-5' RNA ligase
MRAMLASIWLQLGGEQQEILRDLIALLAARHGTVPFQPHLTVCSARDLDPATADIVAEYVSRSGLLPLVVRKAGISHSTTTPFKAVVINIENGPELASFREELRRITGAAEPEPPHISLLYTLGERGQRLGWLASEARLRTIAQECATLIDATEFVLDHPVVVAPDGDWTNIKSWKVLRKL